MPSINKSTYSENYSAAIMEVSQTPIALMNEKGIICSWNKAAEMLFGWREFEAIGKPVTVLMPEAIASQHQKFVEHYLSGGQPSIIGQGREVIARTKHGTTLRIFLTITSFQRDGQTWFVGNMVDLQELTEALERAKIKDDEYRSLFESESLGRLIVAAADWRVVRANRVAELGLDISIGAVKSPKISEIFEVDELEGNKLKRSLTLKGCTKTLWKARNVDSEFEVFISYVPGNEHYMLIEVIDVTDREAAKRKFDHLIKYDAETGLLTRLGIDEHLARCLTDSCGFSFLLVRLANFGKISLSHGNNIAVEALLKLGKRMEAREKSYNIQVGRTRENELAIVLPYLVTNAFSQEVLADLSADLSIGAFRIFPDIRIGAVSSFSLERMRARESVSAFQLAAAALEKSYNRGSPNFQFYDEGFHSEVREQTRMLGLLSNSKRNNELCLCYQPIFNASTLEPEAFEALLRWTSPQIGSVPPSLFIPLAEKGGLISELGLWVFQNALSDFLPELTKKKLRLAINVSAIQLEDRDLPAILRYWALKSNVSPELIDLELTETASFNADAKSISTLRELREIGFGLSLDDFGSGYSALSHLLKIPFDKVKLDTVMLDKAISDLNYHSLCKSIVDFSHSIGGLVVCEGVSSVDHQKVALKLGADYLQGYHLGVPVLHQQCRELYPLCREG
tara:strand:+ start:4394 stop:6439 length:2046 start_codon:yes stop_codon:yes gene_type:complete